MNMLYAIVKRSSCLLSRTRLATTTTATTTITTCVARNNIATSIRCRSTIFAGYTKIQPLTTTTQSKVVDETWVLASGCQEEERRAIAVAEALGLPCTVKHIYARSGWKWLPKLFFRWLSLYHARRILTSDGILKRNYQLPWYLTMPDKKASLDDMNVLPRYAIACGLDAIPACLELEAISRKRTMTVFVGYPKLPFGYFGAVVLIRHQLRRLGRMSMIVLSQKNLIIAESIPHRVTPLTLSVAANQIEKYLPTKLMESLLKDVKSNKATTSSHPLIAVIIGGINAEFRWTTQNAQQYANKIATLTRIVPNSRVIILTTRATPKHISRIFQSIQGEHIYHMDSSQSTDAGYRALMSVLSRATHICITGDSTQLAEEAVSTGKPVYIIGQEYCTDALRVYQNKMKDLHVTRRFRPLRIGQPLPTGNDPLSYMGRHPPFPNHSSNQNNVQSIAKQIRLLNKSRL
ncbi:mitochondrial fission ELM1-domain-containing protein [Syncephalis plumigaleata]|nr:mitochondrial fission ELM1-domain-containing protein [Syncephalis plumigaleata]